ncbi:uncharacterized protein LOC134209019 [Armigeres subalbatus]|uniref:uncharacterized protein LOC134209019 n=1 Tax=Armigeres subalbatus TaxID=124917 RepID=UPI002ED603C5
MDTIAVYKICDVTRMNRHTVTAGRNVISLMKQGSLMLNKPISQIVLENDGCQITSDLALAAFTNSLFMLLNAEERWTSENVNVTSKDTVSGEIIDIGQNLTLSQMPSDVKAIVEAGTSYRILSHQLQLPQNVLAILPEPCGNPTVADPIAMQLMTELEAPDEGQTQFQNLNRQSTRPWQKIYKFLRARTKRINDPGYQQSSKKQATSLLKFRTFEINWNKLGDNLLERLGDLQEFISQNPESAVPRSIRFKKTEMTSLVNNIVDQMRCVDNNIKRIQ